MVMPTLRYMDDLLLDSKYFVAISHALSEGQDVQNLPKYPKLS